MLLDPNPVEFPARWACAWGVDKYGLWQSFEVGEQRQVMRWIAPGQFWMGSPEGEQERVSSELLHQVILTRGYWLADTTCTQALWQEVMGDNPSRFSDDPQCPVEQVSWEDCQTFLEKLNQRLDFTLMLRLPTEAEWEYACRAGTQTPFSFGETLSPEQANYDGRYPYASGRTGVNRERTLPALEFAANSWGLFQMHGNVWEWCADWYGDYPKETAIDPCGPSEGTGRVLRGGGWLHLGRSLRSAFRLASSPGIRSDRIGLRLAGG